MRARLWRGMRGRWEGSLRKAGERSIPHHVTSFLRAVRPPFYYICLRWEVIAVEKREAALGMLVNAFKGRLEGERGLFRTLVSIWFAYAHRGWFLLNDGDTDGDNSSHGWINRFYVADQRDRLRLLRGSLHNGVVSGRFYLTPRAKRAIRNSSPKTMLYIEHSVPLHELRSIIRQKLDHDTTGASNIISCVLEHHLTFGWMVVGEQEKLPKRMPLSPGMPCIQRCRKGKPCPRAFAPNPRHSGKNYANEWHFSRYNDRVTKRSTKVGGFRRKDVSCDSEGLE